MKSVLRTEHLVRTFQDGSQTITVLNDINLDIFEGEFVSVTGASGTGKSTLVYHLGLLDEPTSGLVYVGDTRAQDMSIADRTKYRLQNFGFVFQDYALFPEMYVWENVALPSLMRAVPLQEAKRRAIEVLERLGLGNRVNYTTASLSGGEGQRVSIARAILHKPAVLFADEPTANLDDERSRQIIDIFHALHKEGQTIVMVTHELQYAQEATRLLELQGGGVKVDTAINPLTKGG